MKFNKPVVNPIRVEEILSERGMTKADLAKLMNSDYYTTWRKVNGVLTMKSATEIARALEVPLWQLFISPKDAYDYYCMFVLGKKKD